jgi:hypothetical protein
LVLFQSNTFNCFKLCFGMFKSDTITTLYDALSKCTYALYAAPGNVSDSSSLFICFCFSILNFRILYRAERKVIKLKPAQSDALKQTSLEWERKKLWKRERDWERVRDSESVEERKKCKETNRDRTIKIKVTLFSQFWHRNFFGRVNKTR